MRFTGNRPQHIPSPLRRMLPMLLLVGLRLALGQAAAQSTNEYRSRADGDWTNLGTWERFDGAGWVNATAFPKDSNSETITIRTGFAVTVNGAVGRDIRLDQLVVEIGATLIIEEKTKIQDGQGTDLISYGTIRLASDNLEIEGAVTTVFKSTSILNIDDKEFKFKDTSTGTFENGARINIAIPGRLKAEGSAALTFESGTQIVSDGILNFKMTSTVNLGGSVDNAGTLVVENSAVVTIENTSQIDNSGTISLKDEANVSVYGTLVNTGTFSQAGSSSLSFKNGGIYEHAQNGGKLPFVSHTTWNSGSTAVLTGIVDQLPSEMDASFHHFVWQSTSQVANMNLDAVFTAINGDLSINSTGSGSVSWIQDTGSPLTISGDFVQTGGTFIYADGTGSGTMSATHVTLLGGSLDLSTSTGAVTLALTGNLNISSGSVTETGAGSGTILFSGTSVQSVTAPGGISNDVDIVVEYRRNSITSLSDGAQAHYRNDWDH